MGNERLGLIGWLVAGAVAVAAVLIGFVWLPTLQANALGIGVWDAICRAAGITLTGPAAFASIASSPAAVPTTVVWNPETLRVAASGDAQHAKALALGCAGCHGAEGVSPSEAFPNLAGSVPGGSVQGARRLSRRQAAEPHDAGDRWGARRSDKLLISPLITLRYHQSYPAQSVCRHLWLQSAIRSGPLRLAPHVTARSDAKTAHPRSKDRSKGISRPSSKPSPPERGATTSISRCAISRER